MGDDGLSNPKSSAYYIHSIEIGLTEKAASPRDIE